MNLTEIAQQMHSTFLALPTPEARARLRKVVRLAHEMDCELPNRYTAAPRKAHFYLVDHLADEVDPLLEMLEKLCYDPS